MNITPGHIGLFLLGAIVAAVVLVVFSRMVDAGLDRLDEHMWDDDATPLWPDDASDDEDGGRFVAEPPPGLRFMIDPNDRVHRPECTRCIDVHDWYAAATRLTAAVRADELGLEPCSLCGPFAPAELVLPLADDPVEVSL